MDYYTAIAVVLIVLGSFYGKEYMPAKTGLWDDRIKRIAQAIARAEGWFGIGSANDVQRAKNNPGNLRWGTSEVSSFPTESAGWDALYSQIRGMMLGKAGYSPDDTLQEIALRYTGESAYINWAKNVATDLGVSITTRFGDLA